METGSDLKTGQTCPIHHMTECCGRKVSIEDSLRAERDRYKEALEKIARYDLASLGIIAIAKEALK